MNVISFGVLMNDGNATVDLVYSEITDFVARNKIVCPYPIPWNVLFKRMVSEENRRCANTRSAKEMGLQNPLILAAWHSDDQIKNQRFVDHLEWARSHDQIDLVFSLLKEIPADKFAFFPSNASSKSDEGVWSALSRDF